MEKFECRQFINICANIDSAASDVVLHLSLDIALHVHLGLRLLAYSWTWMWWRVITGWLSDSKGQLRESLYAGQVQCCDLVVEHTNCSNESSSTKEIGHSQLLQQNDMICSVRSDQRCSQLARWRFPTVLYQWHMARIEPWAAWTNQDGMQYSLLVNWWNDSSSHRQHQERHQ